MKAMIAILGLILSMQAHAGDLQCGDTLRAVSNIINQQFPKLDTGAIVACFEGKWGSAVTIEFDAPFLVATAPWEACPQVSGNFIVRKKGSTETGELSCVEGKLTASNFSGMLSMANGKSFAKQVTTVATGGKKARN